MTLKSMMRNSKSSGCVSASDKPIDLRSPERALSAIREGKMRAAGSCRRARIKVEQQVFGNCSLYCTSAKMAATRN